MINSWDLPFHEMPKRPRIISTYHIPSKTMCFNKSLNLTGEESILAEKYCEGIISHEIIHGVLEEVDSWGQYNYFDGWWNGYKISLAIGVCDEG